MARDFLRDGETITIYGKGDAGRFPRTLTVGKVIGCGASNVSYEAEYEGTAGKVCGVLKEFYPDMGTVLMRDDRNHLTASPDAEGYQEFICMRDGYLKDYQKLQSIRSENKNAAFQDFITPDEFYWGCPEDADETGTVYTFTQVRKVPFREMCGDIREDLKGTQRDPDQDLLNILKAIRSLAQGVDVLHGAHLLVTDISPSNFGVIRKGETYLPERVSIIDQDSIQPMDEPMAERKRIKTTPGFSDPRIGYGATAQTDIYAIGATLFYASIITTDTFRAFEKGKEWGYQGEYYDALGRMAKQSLLYRLAKEQGKDRVWDGIVRILQKCLCNNAVPGKSIRYKCCRELLQDLDEVIKWADTQENECGSFEKWKGDRKKDTKSYQLVSRDFEMRPIFEGRRKEMRQIQERFSMGNKAVFLEGLGGIGKSELAKHYAQDHREEYSTVVFAAYTEGLQNVVCEKIDVAGLAQGQDESSREYFERKLRILRQITNEKTLLIIDNFDVKDDPDLKEFLQGGYRVIFTSRMRHRDDHAYVYVSAMKDDIDTLLNIFRKNYESFAEGMVLEEADRPYIIKLIEGVEGHTYSVELLARQMAAGDMSGREMYEKYEAGGLFEIGNDTLHGYTGEHEMSGHIRLIFSFSDLSEDEKQILMELSLLDIHEISRKLFKEWADLPSNDILNRLIGRGWVRIESRGNLSLHPLVKEVIFADPKLRPDPENCADFLTNIARWLFGAWGRPAEDNRPAVGHILALAKNFEPFDGEHHLLWQRIPDFLWQVGEFDMAMKYQKESYDACRKRNGPDSIHTGYCAYRAGECYQNCGERKEAFKYFGQAEASFLTADQRDDVCLARVYERMAMCYVWDFMRDLGKAEDYAEKALEIRMNMERRLKKGVPEIPYYEDCWRTYDLDAVTEGLGHIYQLLAWIFVESGRYDTALDYANRAVDKMESIAPDKVDPASRVLVYYRRGTCHFHLGEQKKDQGDNASAETEWEAARKNLGKCLKVQEKCLGSVSQTVLSTKEYLADTYAALATVLTEDEAADRARENAMQYYEQIRDVLESSFSNAAERISQIRDKMNKMT